MISTSTSLDKVRPGIEANQSHIIFFRFYLIEHEISQFLKHKSHDNSARPYVPYKRPVFFILLQTGIEANPFLCY